MSLNTTFSCDECPRTGYILAMAIAYVVTSNRHWTALVPRPSARVRFYGMASAQYSPLAPSTAIVRTSANDWTVTFPISQSHSYSSAASANIQFSRIHDRRRRPNKNKRSGMTIIHTVVWQNSPFKLIWLIQQFDIYGTQRLPIILLQIINNKIFH